MVGEGHGANAGVGRGCGYSDVDWTASGSDGWTHSLTLLNNTPSPSNVTRVIHIRVVDADRSTVEPTLDSIVVDHMLIRLEP